MSLMPWFEHLAGKTRGRLVLVVLIAAVLTIAMILGIVHLISYLTRGIDITAETNRIFSDVKNCIPDYFAPLLPKNTEELKAQLFE